MAIISTIKAKMAQNDKKSLSVSLHISGTVPDMIVVFGTLSSNFFHFFKSLVFWVSRGEGKGGKK